VSELIKITEKVFREVCLNNNFESVVYNGSGLYVRSKESPEWAIDVDLYPEWALDRNIGDFKIGKISIEISTHFEGEDFVEVCSKVPSDIFKLYNEMIITQTVKNLERLV